MDVVFNGMHRQNVTSVSQIDLQPDKLSLIYLICMSWYQSH